MIGIADRKGNLMKIGDRVKVIVDKYQSAGIKQNQTGVIHQICFDGGIDVYPDVINVPGLSEHTWFFIEN